MSYRHKTRVISNKQMPVRMPLNTTVAVVALLKAYEATEVVWGVMITLLIMLWIVTAMGLAIEEQKEIEL